MGRLREGDGALEIKANAVSGSIVVLRSTTGGANGFGAPQDRPAPEPTGDPTTQIRTEGTSPMPAADPRTPRPVTTRPTSPPRPTGPRSGRDSR